MDSFSEIVKNRQKTKAPAHPWQDLALKVIETLAIPDNKRSAVFKICKEVPPEKVKRAMTDTKELCSTGSAWRYFFKIINQEKLK